MSSQKKKPIRPPSVQIYFGAGALEVYDDLRSVAKVTGMSLSDVAFAGFVMGFYEIRDVLLTYQTLPDDVHRKMSVRLGRLRRVGKS
jgi:hypothetical protein